jgi:lambda repressor-like predicted transcriptional regulator
MHQAGLEVDQLADAAEVDAKTVRRWLSGRTPRGRYRTRVAEALGTTEQEVWPELGLQVAGRDEKGEILAAYARADDLDAPGWGSLLQHARRRIDLLDLTLAEILPSAGTTELLTDKARAGCEVRLLFSAADSAHLVLADNELGEDVGLLDIPASARQAERSLELAESLVATNGIEARTFIAAHSHTILRFDDEMLVTLHLHGADTNRSPILHLKHHSDYGMFAQFATHFDALWQNAQPGGRASVPAD